MVHLLSPGAPGQATGGYRYNDRLVAGLRARGHHVQVHVVDGAWPDPARAVRLRLPPGEPVIADGLLACGVEVEGGPVVVLVHSPLFREQGPGWLAREQDVLRRAEAVVYTGPQSLSDLGVDGVIVAPGVAPERARRRRTGPGLALLCVASLIPRKGHLVLLEALRRAGGGLHLTCVGGDRDPGHAARVRAAAADLPVRFVGERADPTPWYRGADLLVHTAAFEAWGMVIDEALAHGLPVLSTPAGALAAGRPGAQLVPAGDVGQLTAALQAWRDRPALRSAQWGAAWTAHRRGWDAVVSEWEAVLRGLSSASR